jgi:hypothetical protein
LRGVGYLARGAEYFQKVVPSHLFLQEKQIKVVEIAAYLVEIESYLMEYFQKVVPC